MACQLPAREQLDNLTRLTPLPASPLAERAAIDELGDQILAALKITRVVNGEDVGMVERRSHLRFALKPPYA